MDTYLKFKKHKIKKLNIKDTLMFVEPIIYFKRVLFWKKKYTRDPTVSDMYDRFTKYIKNNSKPQIDLNTMKIEDVVILQKKLLK